MATDAVKEPEKVTEAPVESEGEELTSSERFLRDNPMPEDYDPDADPDAHTNVKPYDGALMTPAEIDAFEDDGGSEGTAVMCIFCKNCTEFTADGIRCKAFPEGVPEQIILGFDHRKALGAEKVLFEAKNPKQYEEWQAGIDSLAAGSGEAPEEEEEEEVPAQAPKEEKPTEPTEEKKVKKVVKAKPKAAVTEAPK